MLGEFTELVFTGASHHLTIDAQQAEGFKRLREQTPEPRVARIQGVLDSITVSSRTFVLQLQDGTSLKGLALGSASDQLTRLVGATVVAEGTVAYKPSRRPLRLEADYLAKADPGDRVWLQLPLAEVGSRRPPVPEADLSGVFGRWPGEESDHEIFAAPEELS